MRSIAIAIEPLDGLGFETSREPQLGHFNSSINNINTLDSYNKLLMSQNLELILYGLFHIHIFFQEESPRCQFEIL